MELFVSRRKALIAVGRLAILFGIAYGASTLPKQLEGLTYQRSQPVQDLRDGESHLPQSKLPPPNFELLDAEKFFSCGRNALYMFLLLSDYSSISFKMLSTAIPLSSPQGTSLIALNDAARNLGVKTEARFYLPEQYKAVPLPAIVHICREGSPRWRSHFDVMYRIDDDYVYLLNGTTAQPYQVQITKFGSGDWWTGYALIEERSRWEIVTDRYWATFLWVLLIVYFYALYKLYNWNDRPSFTWKLRRKEAF